MPLRGYVTCTRELLYKHTSEKNIAVDALRVAHYDSIRYTKQYTIRTLQDINVYTWYTYCQFVWFVVRDIHIAWEGKVPVCPSRYRM